MSAQEYVRKGGVWHVKVRGLLHVVPKEEVPAEVREEEARSRAEAPPAPERRPRAERRQDLGPITREYVDLVTRCYVPQSDPREFVLNGAVTVNARSFALFVGAALLGLQLEDWRRWYHAVYHRNNDVLLRCGYRLEEYRERVPRGEGTGEAQFHPPTQQEVSLAAAWSRAVQTAA